MQRFTVFFIIVDALHVSGGFSAHHHELAVAVSKPGTYQMLCVTVLELLMIGGKTARNI
jgi:hypothetical protein